MMSEVQAEVREEIKEEETGEKVIETSEKEQAAESEAASSEVTESETKSEPESGEVQEKESPEEPVDLGWGEKPEVGYAEEVLEELKMPQELLDEYAVLAKENGLPKEQAEKYLDLHSKLMVKQSELWEHQEESQRNELVNKLAQEWGGEEETKNTIHRLSNFVRDKLGDYSHELIFHTTAGINYELVTKVKALMDEMAEPEYFASNNNAEAVSAYLSVKDARQAVTQYHKDNPEAERAYKFPNHPLHKKTREELDSIYQHFETQLRKR